MATLNTTNIKHASSGSNNIVLASDGSTTISNLSNSVGKILQVVNAVKKDIFSWTTTASTISVSGDVTGLNISITPSSASNKILLMPSVSVDNLSTFIYLYKDGSLIDQVGDAANNGDGNALIRSTFGSDSGSINNSTVTGHLLDTAGGTSAITYSIRIGSYWIGSSTKTIYLNRTGSANEIYSASYRLGRYISTFTAMEVAA